LERLFAGLQSLFPWSSVQEATFECAPQTVTEEGLAVLKRSGITRLSLGVQQLDDDVLTKNGRVHAVRDVERAYAAVQQVGFPVVNLDLMVGMLGETEESFFRSLDRIIDWEPDSVTVYQLEIPLNTPLYKELSEAGSPVLPPSWPVKRDRLGAAFSRLEQAGYTVRSGYSAVRDPQAHEFIYQVAQYGGADLLGIGVSSFSYLSGLHYQNATSMDAYGSLLDSGELPIGRAHSLTAEERLVREFILQLKLGAVEFDRFRKQFQIDPGEKFKESLDRFARRGWLKLDDSGVRLTRAGLLRVDHLLPSFYLPQHRGIRYS
jgi:oxygen-independent coproporphyrinogen-3 oxidase